MTDVAPKTFAGKLLSNPNMLEVFRQHGVDVDNPELVKQRVKVRNEHIMRRILIAGGGAKYVHFDSLCLWEGKKRLHSRFEDWNPGLQPNARVAMALKSNAVKMAQLMKHQPKKIVMMGRPGTGKTKLALAMASYLRDNEQTTMFVSSTMLQSLYWSSYKYDDAQKHKEDVLRAMKEVDVLIIDDMGTEGGVRADKAIQSDILKDLEEIATARYDTDNNKVRKSTIVTTNNTLEELENIYSAKLVSRLLPHQLMCKFDFSELKDLRE